jgi:hypothetical protein
MQLGDPVQWHFSENRKTDHTEVKENARVVTPAKKLLSCLFDQRQPKAKGTGQGWDINQFLCSLCDLHWQVSYRFNCQRPR